MIEPVDQENKPVPDGVLADKLLLTNLANYTQPLIRYEVTDRIIVHHEACSCGNPSPWLEVEGRTDDVTSFVQDGKRIQIAPLALYAALKEVHSLSRFQLTVKDNNECILRIVPAVGVSKETAFLEAKKALTHFLATQKVTDFSCVLAPDAPAASKRSGKFKHIVNQQTWSCGGDVIGYYSKIDIERR
ncbi:MAG: hypothetical protein PHU79_00230 [Oscillospiraceae bacterium]|nr:hypothetical protein [Oscillospiraceae bacterium]